MTRYADPHTCPDCRGALPTAATSCSQCRLPLDDATAVELFHTLRHADELMTRLRARRPVAAAPVPPTAVVPPFPARTEIPGRTGIRTTSVPGVLLSLGALCLLVAAVIFLAVAWAWLGIGGRTAVLIGLTVVATVSGLLAARRGLRVAGESLTVVALGLVALDVVGADNAGWWGRLDASGLTLVVGLVVTVAALAIAALPVRLVSPQVVAGLSPLVAYAGALGSTRHDAVVDTASAVLLIGIAGIGMRSGRKVLAYVTGPAVLLPWLHLVLDAIGSGLEDPTVRGIWTGPGPALLTAALIVVLPLALGDRDGETVQALGGVAATLVTVAVALPVVDEGVTPVATASLATLIAWTLAANEVPDRWRRLPLMPAVAAAAPVASVVVLLCLQAVGSVGSVGPVFTEDIDAPLGPVDPVAAPWLLLAGVAALLALAWVSARPSGPQWEVAASAAFTLGGVATLALLPVPLAAVVAALVGVAGLLLLADSRIAATVVLVAAVCAALPSALLTGLTALAAVAAGAWCLRPSQPDRARILGGAVTPAAAALAVWALGEANGLDEAVRGYPILLTVGLLALALPRPEVEASGWLAVLVFCGSAIGADGDPMTSAAIHLTLAGTLVGASAVVHPHRRVLGWAGGALLASATWIRLADLGVEAPEAYTLPSALALLAVGLYRLHHDPGAPTATALGPGLVLATVPSLLWCLEDPLSWRAVWLGAGCLGLLLLGSLARWNAPIVVGGTVGGLLVVRELAPYAAQTPQWVLIGAAGTLLTVVGVTWERRLVEVRRAADYLERLR